MQQVRLSKEDMDPVVALAAQLTRPRGREPSSLAQRLKRPARTLRGAVHWQSAV